MSRNATTRTKRSPTNSIKRLLFLVKIEGESLWPELIPGKRYAATSLGKPDIGDYLVFKNPGNNGQTFVKKIRDIRDGAYEVAGTVPWASSSNEFGLILRNSVVGKIILPKLIRF